MQVIFILGSGHCGSTLLDLILDSHSDIVGVGELETITQDVTGEDSFWNNIAVSIPPHGIEVWRKKLDFLLDRQKYYNVHSQTAISNDAYRTLHTDLYTTLIEKTHTSIVVDSSKSIDRFELLAGEGTIQPIILHLVRDGRGVLWSYMKKYPRNTLFSFTKWFLSNMKIEIVRRRVNAPYVFVRYEDLVEDPQKTITHILSCIGREYEEGMLDFRSFKHHHIGGNRMKKGSSSDIYADKGWKKELPFLWRVLFSILFGWLNYFYQRKGLVSPI